MPLLYTLVAELRYQKISGFENVKILY